MRIILEWIPSHCELPEKEAADRLAKKGASQDQPDTPVNQDICKQIIKEKRNGLTTGPNAIQAKLYTLNLKQWFPNFFPRTPSTNF